MCKWGRRISLWILLLLVTVNSVTARRRAKGGDERHLRTDKDYNLEEEVEKATKEEVRELLNAHWPEENAEDDDDDSSWPWAVGEGGIGDPLCPSPNPKPRPTKALCEAKPCLAHDRCPPPAEGGEERVTKERRAGEQRESACCFNGCVYTCMKKMPMPLAFDWVEETPDSLPAGNWSHHGDEDHMSRVQSETPPETVVLAGGCLLSTEQYKHLEGFRRNEHIKKCFCDGGGVFCEVDRGKI